MANNEYTYGIDAERYPHTVKYLQKHGLGGAMSIWDLKHPYKTTEQVYKECLKRGVTWQQLLNFKGYSKNILL